MRKAEVYELKGVRGGSFKVFAEIEADEVFNDNVNASQNAKRAGFIQLISPSLALRSDWTNHMLNVYAKSGIGLYGVSGPRTTSRTCRWEPTAASTSSVVGMSMAAPPRTGSTKCRLQSPEREA